MTKYHNTVIIIAQKVLKLKGFEVLESQKKVAWLNTVRVFASLTVILSHYVLLEQIEVSHEKIHWALAGIGHIGIILFFAVSGYLASNSLQRSKNVFEFYRRKLIRIIVPFSVAYIVLGMFFILLGIVEPTLAQRSPFYNVIYVGGIFRGILFSILPIDANLIMYFALPSYWFVGEWFIGMIIYMYLIAPLLDKILRYNFFVAIILSLLLSWTVYNLTFPLQASKNITSWWIFIVRAPEFLLGMAFFVYRDFILKYRAKIISASAILIFAFSILLYIYGDTKAPFFVLLCFDHPIDFMFSLPMIYLFFTFAEWLNEKFSAVLANFNSFSDISYVMMLIQRIVIELFADSFDFTNLSNFGIFFMFMLIVLTIIFVSQKIHDIYKPIEEWMIKNFLVRK